MQEEACTKGYQWFCKKYPNGLQITKKNIEELYNKLMKRKSGFESNERFFVAKQFDSIRTLMWILDSMQFVGDKQLNLEDWDNGTKKDIINAWWKDYKRIK